MLEDCEEKIYRSVSLREPKYMLVCWEVKNFKMKTTFGFSKPNTRARSFGDFYNLSTNQEPPIGGTTSCRPIGIENFQNINKRWRYCTEKEEKWAKETKYSAVQLLTNNAFWREKNGGKRKRIREQFHFWTWLVYTCLRASERVRFQSNFNIDHASAAFLAVCWLFDQSFSSFLEYF